MLTMLTQSLNPSSDREKRDKSVDMLGQAPPDGPAKELPSIDDQVKTIMEQMAASQADPRDGNIGYAVSMAWLNRVLARSSSSKDHGPYDKSVLEGEIGHIDNSDILLSSESSDKGAALHIIPNSRSISQCFWQFVDNNCLELRNIDHECKQCYTMWIVANFDRTAGTHHYR